MAHTIEDARFEGAGRASDAARVAHPLDALARGHDNGTTGRYRFFSKDGRMVTIEARPEVVPDADGRTRGIGPPSGPPTRASAPEALDPLVAGHHCGRMSPHSLAPGR